MAYNNNVPLANQRIKDTQQPILDNFAGIKTLVDINHETFDTADQGKHKFVTLTNQGVAPAGGATEYNIYNSVVAGAQHISLRLGAGTAVPFTQATGGSSGWSYLPSGIKLWWSTTGAIVLPFTDRVYIASVPTFPGFTSTPAVFAQTTNTANVFIISMITNLGFRVTPTANGSGCFFAVGS